MAKQNSKIRHLKLQIPGEELQQTLPDSEYNSSEYTSTRYTVSEYLLLSSLVESPATNDH